jgi:adenine C2-methylase RlmN of 23S rRNA A2503 and tRNA A37
MAPSGRRRALTPKPIFDEPSLADFFTRYEVKTVHMGTIWKHLISHPECPLDEIPRIPDRIRKPLAAEFAICTSTVAKYVESEIDHTVKILVRLQDGSEIESVIINHTGEPDEPDSAQKDRCGARNTLCISSQVGCALRCTFCATGTMGLQGNLWPGEILEQLWHARRYREVQNVVYMGMGEPLENYDAVVSSIRGLTDPHRFGLAPSSVTVSTVGIIPKMRRLMHDAPKIKLALSLHAPNQALRETIVPVCKDRNVQLSDLMALIDEYASKVSNDGKRKGMIMMSYVMLRGVNDSDAHAVELRDLLRDRPVIVNLIPYNPFEGNAHEYETTPPDQVDSFLQILIQAGIRVFERRHHGRDIAAACGQLAKIEAQKPKDIEACDCSLSKDRVERRRIQPEATGQKERFFEPGRKQVVRERAASDAGRISAAVAVVAAATVLLTATIVWRRSSARR